MISFLVAALVAHSKTTTFNLKLGKNHVIETPGVIALAPAPTGDKVAVSLEDGTIRIYNAINGKLLSEFNKHPQQAYGLAWSPDGRYVASGDETARIYVWNPYNGIVVDAFRKNLKGIQCLSFDKSRKFLLCTSKDDVVTVYNLRTKKIQDQIHGDGINLFGAHYSPESNYFCAATLTATSHVYSPTGTSVKSFAVLGGQGAMDAEYSPDGKKVVFASKNGTAQMFDVHSSKRIGTFYCDTDWVTSAIFSPDGRVIATSSVDRSVKLWNTKTMAELAVIPDCNPLGSPIAFTSDGKYLVSSNGSSQLQITAIEPHLAGKLDAGKKPTTKKHRYTRRRKR